MHQVIELSALFVMIPTNVVTVGRMMVVLSEVMYGLYYYYLLYYYLYYYDYLYSHHDLISETNIMYALPSLCVTVYWIPSPLDMDLFPIYFIMKFI